jgi:hypothetical protein
MKAWPREGQALPFQADDRLSFGGHRQARLRKRTITCGKFCAPNAVALDSVFFQCSPVGRGDQALRRQNAGGRTACNSSRSDKFRDRCLGVVLRCVPLRSDVNLRGPM